MDQDRADKIEQLLNAALPEFARSGLDGARVDAIARAAGMNKRLLYHYVGDKAALFDAALGRAIERIQAAPEEIHTHEWRLVCHGVAEGREMDLTGVLACFQGEGIREGRAAKAGLVLLASLLPDLADPLLGNRDGDRGRPAALKASLGAPTPEIRPPKPRLKLRPDLRSA